MTSLNTCPRCGQAFACGANDPTPCPCTGLALPRATLERLRRAHVGCLCLECLRQEARHDALPPPAAPPASGA